jgi:RES domain-containing protein
MQDLVDRVFLTCPVAVWSGDVWRVHTRRYAATDPGGSLRSLGRWHRGGRTFPPDQIFATLYTAASDVVATWELIRHSRATTAQDMWLRFTTVSVSRLHVRLAAALDLRDPSPAGLTVDALTGADFLLPQSIGATAFERGLEGLLVPSATGVGEPGRDFNVVIYPDNLRANSEVRLVNSQTPKLPA